MHEQDIHARMHIYNVYHVQAHAVEYGYFLFFIVFIIFIIIISFLYY